MPPRRRIRAFVGIVLLACGFWSYVLLRRSPEPQEEKRTIVLTAYETQGLRPAWLRQIVEQYASEDYADLIDAILLVWNAPEEEPPADLPAKVQVIRAAANSLNNRWLFTPEYAQAGPVIILDNDLLLSRSGVRCLQTVQRDHPDRLIGPYVRRREGSIYVLDELMSRSSPYNFVLPRALIGHTDLLDLYRKPELAQLHAYVDKQEAHCDDLLLNLAVSNDTGLAPLRVALPPNSVRDFATYCSPLDRAQSAGLADQPDRWKYRTECLQHLLSHAGLSIKSSPEDEDVALCNRDGDSYEVVSEVGLPRWRSMSTARAIDLCPELVPERDLAAESRLGLGRELVEYCPELNPSTTEWVNALIEKPICGDGGAIQDPPLLASAKHQCGAWCMWDLRVRGKTGWRLTGSCFERFEGGHPECDKWFYQRPHMHL